MTNYTVVDNNLITNTDLPDSTYRLYCFLLSMCYGDKNTCYPSIAYLSQKLNKSVKTIGRNLKILKDKGLIVARRRGSISNVYTLVKKVINTSVEKSINIIKEKFSNIKYAKKQGAWNDYPQRNYNFDELEKGLLGELD